MFDDPFLLQQGALAAVACAPVVAAALCALLGRRDHRRARRVAMNAAR